MPPAEPPRLSPLLLACALACGCASALREPPPLVTIGAAEGTGAAAAGTTASASPDELLRQAETRFRHRPEVSEVAAARELFLEAARRSPDPSPGSAEAADVRGLLGAARTSAWLIEHEHDPARRGQIATEAVAICQWCERRAPTRVECRYRLALALGQQAREHPSTAKDALARMVALLGQVITADPLLDEAGGDRVLALTLLRAPGWPLGPGDPEQALVHAREADALVPERPANLLVLGEALAKNGDAPAARLVYERARALAERDAANGDPDAGESAASARRALAALE